MARIGIKDFDTAGLWVRDLAVTYRNGVTALKSASFALSLIHISEPTRPY